MNEPITQLTHRLVRMQKHRAKWGRRQGITCWRIYDHDISDQPLVIDWYAGDIVCWSWRRTKDETPAQDEAWIESVRVAVQTALAVAPERVWMKRRRQQTDRQHGGQYERLAEHSTVREVHEGGLRFAVNFSDYLDVGLFLDHRPMRLRLGKEARNLDVLNLFCYTGAFTCHAAQGGARSTVSVDLSNTYLDWARRNLASNGLVGAGHSFERADCLEWLKAAANKGQRFDRIICDPPTFSNSTGMEGSFSIDRDHDWVIRMLRALLRPGGVAYFSTNSRRFVPGPSLATASEITAQTTDEDFRGRPAHRCWQLDSAES